MNRTMEPSDAELSRNLSARTQRDKRVFLFKRFGCIGMVVGVVFAGISLIVRIRDEDVRSEATEYMWDAIENDRYDEAAELVREGADVNLQVDDTPLTYAVKHKQFKMARALLMVGGDPNLVNLKGESPLALARQAHRVDLVALLLQAGAMDQRKKP